MSRTFRNTSSTNKFRIRGNPMTLDKVSDSNKHRKCRCEWCVSNRTISSKRQLERTDYELSRDFHHEYERKILDFCDIHSVVFNHKQYTVYVNNVSVSNSKGWSNAVFNVERVEDECGDIVIVTNHHLYEKIVDTVALYYERDFLQYVM